MLRVGNALWSVIRRRNTLACVLLPTCLPSPGNECFGQIPDFQVDQETYFDARVDGPYTVASQVGAGRFRAVAAAGQSGGPFAVGPALLYALSSWCRSSLKRYSTPVQSSKRVWGIDGWGDVHVGYRRVWDNRPHPWKWVRSRLLVVFPQPRVRLHCWPNLFKLLHHRQPFADHFRESVLELCSGRNHCRRHGAVLPGPGRHWLRRLPLPVRQPRRRVRVSSATATQSEDTTAWNPLSALL